MGPSWWTLGKGQQPRRQKPGGKRQGKGKGLYQGKGHQGKGQQSKGKGKGKAKAPTTWTKQDLKFQQQFQNLQNQLVQSDKKVAKLVQTLTGTKAPDGSPAAKAPTVKPKEATQAKPYTTQEVHR